MEIYFTDHAEYQLKERNIPRVEVERTVRRPDKTSKQLSGRICAVRKFKKQRKAYILVTVYEIRKHRIEVITAFLTPFSSFLFPLPPFSYANHTPS